MVFLFTITETVTGLSTVTNFLLTHPTEEMRTIYLENLFTGIYLSPVHIYL
jgi:hypothetical protein